VDTPTKVSKSSTRLMKNRGLTTPIVTTRVCYWTTLTHVRKIANDTLLVKLDRYTPTECLKSSQWIAFTYPITAIHLSYNVLYNCYFSGHISKI